MSKIAAKMYLMGLQAKTKMTKLWKNERGEANIIAIILVLAIVIALAVIFRKQITGLFDRIWGSVNDSVDEAL